MKRTTSFTSRRHRLSAMALLLAALITAPLSARAQWSSDQGAGSHVILTDETAVITDSWWEGVHWECTETNGGPWIGADPWTRADLTPGDLEEPSTATIQGEIAQESTGVRLRVSGESSHSLWVAISLEPLPAAYDEREGAWVLPERALDLVIAEANTPFASSHEVLVTGLVPGQQYHFTTLSPDDPRALVEGTFVFTGGARVEDTVPEEEPDSGSSTSTR